ncbi:MAG: VOC family protein [Chloroflexi bacterium]|nr:VOC family protein [Chloroflexota bacterium]
MPLSHVPKGVHSVTPYLQVENPNQLIDFIMQIFDASVVLRIDTPDGGVSHAHLLVEGSAIYLAGTGAQWPALTAALHVYVPDVDATYQKALAAGATSLFEPMDMFYGERGAGVRDATGMTWYLAKQIEELSSEELLRRARGAQAP